MGLYSTPGLDLHLQSGPGGPFDDSQRYIDAAGEELGQMSDADLADAYLSAMGRVNWNRQRAWLIDDALEAAGIEDDPQHTAEHDRLHALPDAELLAACREHMGAVLVRHKATLYQPERTVTHWSYWLDRFIDDLSEPWLKAQREASERDAAEASA